MKRRTIAAAVLWAMPCLVLSISSSLCPAQESNQSSTQTGSSSPAAQYKKLVSEYEAAQQEYFKAFQAAETDEERQKLGSKYPNPQQHTARFLDLAQKNPASPAAMDALVWIVQNGRTGSDIDQALIILAKDHLRNEKIGPVCQGLVHSQAQGAEKFLREVLEKNANRDVQGLALMSLGQLLKNRLELARYLKDARPEQMNMFEQFYGKETVEKLQKTRPEDFAREIEGTFEKVLENYAGVASYGRALGDRAKAELFEIRNLAIGKAAPEIEGEDVSGQKFKLSQYRGKVVVLDFWGDW